MRQSGPQGRRALPALGLALLLSFTACSPKSDAQLEQDVQQGVNNIQDGAEQLGDRLQEGAKDLGEKADAVGDGVQKGLTDGR
ncbi:hypothetical protein [Deinococcus maricopensis]|uniref:Lipoprotein n=1 Tax=Deinococcus maricopensis (strain DSM 21211 / LMG 22137 / NRRL B-23946 / LB-34) TaxID=709986 RepID=E8U8W9_DEIML|nr:hypothetical protein [Deinococcus maricopensis]ADV67508.1 hypothetical protein Deima_1861 [Deinococcus maricopensis DSM 21211]